jgi:hypothetical protein
VLFAIGVALADQVPAGSAQALTPAQIREDLVYLRDLFGTKDKSFDARGRAEFNSFVNDAITHVDSLLVPQFALDVARAVAIAHNTHTAAYPQALFHAMPLRLWWFSDGATHVSAAG